MGTWEAAQAGLDLVTKKAHPWAADVALIVIAVAAAFSIMTALGLASRKLFGMGATPSEVTAILDKKINGGLDRIEKGQREQGAILAELDRKVDEQGERLAYLEGVVRQRRAQPNRDWRDIEVI